MREVRSLREQLVRSPSNLDAAVAKPEPAVHVVAEAPEPTNRAHQGKDGIRVQVREVVAARNNVRASVSAVGVLRLEVDEGLLRERLGNLREVVVVEGDRVRPGRIVEWDLSDDSRLLGGLLEDDPDAVRVQAAQYLVGPEVRPWMRLLRRPAERQPAPDGSAPHQHLRKREVEPHAPRLTTGRKSRVNPSDDADPSVTGLPQRDRRPTHGGRQAPQAVPRRSGLREGGRDQTWDAYWDKREAKRLNNPETAPSRVSKPGVAGSSPPAPVPIIHPGVESGPGAPTPRAARASTRALA